VIRGIMRIRIGKWSPGRGLAIAFLLLCVAGAATLFFAFAIPPVVRDLREFAKELPWRGPQWLGGLKRLPFTARLDVTALTAKVQGYASNFVGYVLMSVSTWATKVADIITAIVLTIYFMLEGDEAYLWGLSLFPRDMRLRLDRTLKIAEVRMGKWLLGQASLMLILGMTSTIVFLFLHVRYAYALGVVTGMLNIVPVLGAAASLILALLVAALDSWGRVLGVAIFFLVYLQVENSYLVPRIMRNRVDLPALGILVALLLGFALEGVAGALVSVPTAVLVAVLLEEYLVKKDPEQQPAGKAAD